MEILIMNQGRGLFRFFLFTKNAKRSILILASLTIKYGVIRLELSVKLVHADYVAIRRPLNCIACLVDRLRTIDMPAFYILLSDIDVSCA